MASAYLLFVRAGGGSTSQRSSLERSLRSESRAARHGDEGSRASRPSQLSVRGLTWPLASASNRGASLS